MHIVKHVGINKLSLNNTNPPANG